MSVFLNTADGRAFLRFRRSQLRVYAPVEFRHIHYLIRLRVSRKVSHTGHHVVGVVDAVIDVIHNVGKIWIVNGLQPADLEEVCRPVGAVSLVLLISFSDADFHCLVVVY